MKKKIVSTCAVVALAACAFGGATLAYFTAADDATNTFTVGDVQITLDEAAVDEYGNETDAPRVDSNEYKLIPGHVYVKDPTVVVAEDSEPCYVRMTVTVSDIEALKTAFPASDYTEFYQGELFLLQKLVGGWNKAVWPCVEATEVATADGEIGVYEFWYKGEKGVDGIVDARESAVTLESLFKTVEIPGTATADSLAGIKGMQIDVLAEAMQADTFADAAAAWAAFDGE